MIAKTSTLKGIEGDKEEMRFEAQRVDRVAF